MNTKLIVFDYGETLVHEVSFDTLKGNKQVFSLVKENKFNITVEDLQNKANELYFDIDKLGKKMNLETPFVSFSRLLYDSLGLTFDKNLEELEFEFCKNAYTLAPIEGAKSTLLKLNEAGIEVAIMSNTPISSKTLKLLVESVFPMQKFKFIMTSSEYILKKPEKIFFEAMINKSGYLACEIMFCGDKPHRDIVGAENVKIKAVLLDENDKHINFDGCKINNLSKLIDYIN